MPPLPSTMERPAEAGVPPPPEVLFEEARQRRRRRWARVLAVLVVAAAGASIGYGAIGHGGRTRAPRNATAAASSKLSGTSTRAATGGLRCTNGRAVTNCLVALSFVNSKLGFADATGPSRDQIVATTDGGSTWHEVGRAPPVGSGSVETKFPTLVFVDPSNGIEYGTEGAFATHDGGHTWTPIPTPGRVVAMTSAGRSLWLTDTTCPVNPSAAACTVGIEVSRDAGRTWRALVLPAGPYRAAQTAVGPGDTLVVAEWSDHEGYVSDNPGELLVSDDGGGSWRTTSLPCPTGERLGGQLSRAPSSRTMWMICSGETAPFGQSPNVVYRSTDLGASWVAESINALSKVSSGTTIAPLGAPEGTIDALDARSSENAWVLELNGGLVATGDGGRSWRDATPSTIRRRLASQRVTLDVVSPTDAYVAVHAFLAGSGGLWRTEDGGTNWDRL